MKKKNRKIHGKGEFFDEYLSSFERCAAHHDFFYIPCESFTIFGGDLSSNLGVDPFSIKERP